jgi:hypothetical protein
VGCKGMILKGFCFVAFFAGVKFKIRIFVTSLACQRRKIYYFISVCIKILEVLGLKPSLSFS